MIWLAIYLGLFFVLIMSPLWPLGVLIYWAEYVGHKRMIAKGMAELHQRKISHW